MRPASLLIAVMLGLSLLSCVAAAAPPPGKAAQANAPPSAPAPKVVMYTTADCGYCARARAWFEQRGIAWQEIDILASEAARREFQSRGGQGTPLIFVGETRVTGFDPVRLEALLAAR